MAGRTDEILAIKSIGDEDPNIAPICCIDQSKLFHVKVILPKIDSVRRNAMRCGRLDEPGLTRDRC